MTQHNVARGWTRVEVVAVVVVVAFVVAGAAVFLVGGRKARITDHGMKDSYQVRGIQQSMEIWAQQNKGMYPLPSVVDARDLTVAEKGAAKDTTANILSLLVYIGGISTELCISPQEADVDHVTQDLDYEFETPKRAVDPLQAMWDPAFSSDFTGTRISNNSYAHAMPGGSRAKMWQDSGETWWPVVGNRGPEVARWGEQAEGKGAPEATLVNPKSFTLLIHGGPTTWEGNIGYADGHVNYETSMFPTDIVTWPTEGKGGSDCLFFDETERVGNALLGVFTTAGIEDGAFTLIWD